MNRGAWQATVLGVVKSQTRHDWSNLAQHSSTAVGMSHSGPKQFEKPVRHLASKVLEVWVSKVTWEWSLVTPLTLSVISFLCLASESCFLLVGIKDLFPTTEAEVVASSFSLSLAAEAPQEVSGGLGWIINPSQQQHWTQCNGISHLGRQWSNGPVAAVSTVMVAAAQAVSNQTVAVVWSVAFSVSEPLFLPFPKSEFLDLLLIF